MIYVYKTQAKSSDIDILNHVNNEVYLRWLMEAAIDHAGHLGFPVSDYTKLGTAFVVRRHEIDYLASAVLNDDILVETWCGEVGTSTAVREYQILRAKDRKVLINAKSLFVWIDLTTGRPKVIPENMAQAFKAYFRT